MTAAGAAPAIRPPGPPVLGMQVAPLSPDARSQYNIPDTVKGGVVVQSVKGTSDAADKGLEKGDVIVQAGDHEIASAGDLAAAVAEWKHAGRTSIPIAVRRGGQMPRLSCRSRSTAKAASRARRGAHAAFDRRGRRRGGGGDGARPHRGRP